MKQLVMEGPRKSRIVNVPVPEISGAQLLVKVTLTGMCHSEWYPWSTAKKGDVFGHEAVGVVEAVGPGVSKFKPGDRVTGLGGGGYKEFIVMEEAKACRVPDGLDLAGQLVCAHGRLGVGGYHNDGPRTLDWKLWNFKAMTVVNCHERRIDYETTLCPRCLDLIDRGYWKFRGVTRIYSMDEFDRANEDMESHRDNFIKGAVRIA